MAMVWINRIAAVLMICIILFVLVKRHVVDSDKLDSNTRFTIATVYKISYPVDGGPDVEFQYCVNQSVYKDFVMFDPKRRRVAVGDKFLLKYYPPDPGIAEILLDKPLDSLSGVKVQIDTCRR